MDKAHFRVMVKRGRGSLQESRSKDVIGVKKNYILARRKVQTAIPVGGLTDKLVKANIPNSRIVVASAKLRRLVGRSVVADHQFVISELLRQYALNSLGQILRGVVSGNANADFWHFPRLDKRFRKSSTLSN